MLKLNFLGFNTNTDVTIKVKQKEDLKDLKDIDFKINKFEKNEEKFAFVPVGKEDDYFIYELFYKQNSTDKLSISILNSICSNFDNAKFKVYTNFQDNNIDAETLLNLPKSLYDLGNIIL